MAAPGETQPEQKINGLVSLPTSASQNSPTESASDLSGTARAVPILVALPQDATPGAELNAEPSTAEAEEYLRIFRTQKLKHFPFLYIPLTTSAQDLRAEKSFLWLCIMAVSTRSTAQQALLCNLVRKAIADRILFSLEKSLDLLFGLLTCISWGNFQIQMKPFTSLYTQLAVSLVFDLGLNKPAPKDPHAMSDYRFHLSQVRSTRSMEERRAVLGCFVASSIVSIHLRRIDSLRWTAHMNECLQKLTEAQECAGDAVLAHLVRSQLILEKIPQSPWQSSQSVEGEGSTAAEGLAVFYQKALLVELHEVRQKIPLELQQNDVVLLNLYHVQLRIYEVALSQQAQTLPENCNLHRVENLHACLSAAKSWFEVFLAIPPAEYIGFPFATFSQLAACAIALYKISTLEEPAWDKTSARRTADVLTIADQVAQNLERVRALAGLQCDGGEDVFARVAGKIRVIMQKWTGVLSVDFSEFPSSTVSTAQEVDMSNLSADPSLNLSEYTWLVDILGSGSW